VVSTPSTPPSEVRKGRKKGNARVEREREREREESRDLTFRKEGGSIKNSGDRVREDRKRGYQECYSRRRGGGLLYSKQNYNEMAAARGYAGSIAKRRKLHGVPLSKGLLEKGMC